MKLLKVFALFVILHATGWIAAHLWMQGNPNKVLVVVDTSYAMKPHAVEVKEWVEGFGSSQRYTTIEIGTDKTRIGDLSEMKSLDPLARTFFGKFDTSSLVKYQGSDAAEKILLSDGSEEPAGWRVVVFN